MKGDKYKSKLLKIIDETAIALKKEYKNKILKYLDQGAGI
jgi:hypothetical protein